MSTFNFLIISIFVLIGFSSACKPRPPGGVAEVYTPYDSKGNLNLSVVPQIVQYLYNGGIKKILVNGPLTGDAELTSLAEAKLIFEAYINASQSKGIAVFCHLGGRHLPEAMELAKYGCQIGCDGVIVLPPVFIKPNTTTMLVNDVSLIANVAGNCATYYDDLPKVTGVSLNMVKFAAEAVKKIKFFGGMFISLREALRVQASLNLTRCQAMYIRDPFSILDVYLRGFNGSVSFTASLMPNQVVSIQQAVAANNYSGALTAQNELSSVIIEMFKAINNDALDSSLYTTLASVGRQLFILISNINVGYRAPITRITGLNRQLIRISQLVN